MNEPTFDHIRIDTDINIGGAVAHLVFDRPHVRNALNEPMMQEIGVAVDYLAGRADLRVVVLRGAGGHFCAGGDLNMMVDTPPRAEDGSDPEKARYRRFGEMLQRLNVLPQAVVAVVEGTCVGGGFGMVACADLVIAGTNARFGLPEPRHGFIPSQIIPFLVRRLGEATVRRIAITASVLDAAEAHRVGIADLVVPNDGIEAALARELANLRRAAPGAVAAVKRLVLESSTEPLMSVLDNGATELLELLRGGDAAEGIAAFLAKRPPRWN